ncbi:MAG: 4-hydroxyphenylpyruvate dioxygenase [bacterium]
MSVTSENRVRTENPCGLKQVHHVEFWVGNAKQADYYYRNAFGFSRFAYSGLETKNRETTSYALKQGNAVFLLTTPLNSGHRINGHLSKHGDGVQDIAFEVEDCDKAYAYAVSQGAKGIVEPHDVTDEHGTVRWAVVGTYGDTVHSLIQHKDYSGPFLPGFTVNEVPGKDAGILRIDHIVGNVELGRMNEWAAFYENVFGFHRYITFDDEDISTEYSALMSIVMSNNTYAIKFPINEPAEGKKKSQIEEYIDFYEGAGAQHVALLTDDIIETLSKLYENGVEFLNVPLNYYDGIKERVGEIREPMDVLKELRVLIDRDDEGYLLQLFTKPVEDRPTLFFEIIQRRGSRGFGKGNFKALFEAIEQEQERRGNL